MLRMRRLSSYGHVLKQYRHHRDVAALVARLRDLLIAQQVQRTAYKLFENQNSLKKDARMSEIWQTIRYPIGALASSRSHRQEATVIRIP